MNTISSIGWFVRLDGEDVDLRIWERELKEPFGPWIERLLHQNVLIYALRASEFDGCADASEVRELALPLIDRLNGALAMSARSERIEFDGAGSVDQDGLVHLTIFLEFHDRVRMADDVFVGAGVDANGNLLPAPPPEPSSAQKWSEQARINPDLGDLLAFAGRQHNWFDIYKAIEVAERIAGSEHKLRDLVGNLGDDLKKAKSTANNHRHSQIKNPKANMRVEEAAEVLAKVVAIVFDTDRRRASDESFSQ